VWWCGSITFGVCTYVLCEDMWHISSHSKANAVLLRKGRGRFPATFGRGRPAAAHAGSESVSVKISFIAAACLPRICKFLLILHTAPYFIINHLMNDIGYVIAQLQIFVCYSYRVTAKRCNRYFCATIGLSAFSDDICVCVRFLMTQDLLVIETLTATCALGY